jgi:hypothetical protein
MTIIKRCSIAAVALAIGAWNGAARADEAYVCDAGRVVYVKPGQLEIMKLQDPCVARYFENTPSARPAARPPQTADAAATVAPTASPAPVARKQAVDPIADYRNVRIINASPGAEAWFQHRR